MAAAPLPLYLKALSKAGSVTMEKWKAGLDWEKVMSRGTAIWNGLASGWTRLRTEADAKMLMPNAYCGVNGDSVRLDEINKKNVRCGAC